MGFLADLGLSAVDGAIQIGSNMLQNYHNKEMAQYQNDWNLEMWNRQNEYNSPKATMNRLVEAGINPRAYQQIGQFANAGSPQPAAQMNKISELSGFQTVVRQALENDLLREKVKQVKQDTKTKEYQGGKYLTSKALDKLKFISESLKSGFLPEDIEGYMVNNYRSWDNGPLEPAYRDSELYKFITGGKSTNPYLKAKYLDNLLKSYGYSLRKLESDFKSKELDDYKNYGIRGNSNFVNAVRGITQLIKEMF